MAEASAGASNLARVQALYAAYAAGNRAAFDDLIAPDITWYSAGPETLPWAGCRQGRDSVLDYFRTLEREALVEAYTPEHSVAQGDWLILMGTIRIRLHGGEARDYPKVDAFRFRDGQVVEFREYYDTAAAQAHYAATPRRA